MDIKEKVKVRPIGLLSDAISLAETIEEMNELQSRRSNRRTSCENKSEGLKRNNMT